MSAQGGATPNIDLSRGRRRAEKIAKGESTFNIPKSPSKAFDIFIEEGAIFGIRKGKDEIKRFIPDNPTRAIESTFRADQFIPSSVRAGKRVGRLFRFDF